jgi:Lon protease-like protein
VVPELLPLFPLNTVLVPGLVMPLHIFEPRYRHLVEELLEIPDEDNREFGVIAVREGKQAEVDGVDALYPIGTATVLRQVERLEDGRFDIVTTGSRRFRVLTLDTSAPLLRAEVEFLPDESTDADAVIAQHVARIFTAYRSILGGQLVADDDADISDLPDDPTVLSYLITAAMVLPTQERQELLGAPDTATRLVRARALLSRENALISALGAVPAIELTNVQPSVN